MPGCGSRDGHPVSAAGDGEAMLPLPLCEVEWQRVVEVLALSPQQARIVELILRGMRDKQIALALGLRVPTVRTHLSRLFARLHIADRVELILKVFAICRGSSASSQL